ncbi:MipA/OmpV family protein [Litorimonas sp. RW-G-Af-16]|uniref:MipA/OmpV family protein n=1 Tax=Litorimonas sp. RW-G-Af-16 TaxID=3241168 RepID=UPI00390C86AA
MPRLPLIPSALITAMLAFATPSAAQDSIFTVSEKQNKTFVDVGAAALIRETYVGSEKSSVLPLPFVSAGYKGRYFFNPALGAGVYAINNDHFRLGATTNISLGRKGDDTPFNNDAFEVDPTLTAAAFTRVYLPIAAFDTIATVPVVGGLDGMRVDALLSTSFSPLDNVKITPGVRATYHSRDWINTQYGITDAQAAAVSDTFPALTALDLDGQVSTLGVHTAVYWTVNENYEVIGAVNHSVLQGDAKDSPLTPKNTGTTLALAIARKF